MSTLTQIPTLGWRYISAYGFWGGRFERAPIYKRHELENKCQYGQRIRGIEHSAFTPLVFSVTGGMGRAATTVYQRLAAMISGTSYNRTIRCKLSFYLLRASIMAIRGTRSSVNEGALLESITLQCAEGHLLA